MRLYMRSEENQPKNEKIVCTHSERGVRKIGQDIFSYLDVDEQKGTMAT